MSFTQNLLEPALKPVRDALLPSVLQGRHLLRSLQAFSGMPSDVNSQAAWSPLAIVHYWLCQAAT